MKLTTIENLKKFEDFAHFLPWLSFWFEKKYLVAELLNQF